MNPSFNTQINFLILFLGFPFSGYRSVGLYATYHQFIDKLATKVVEDKELIFTLKLFEGEVVALI